MKRFKVLAQFVGSLGARSCAGCNFVVFEPLWADQNSRTAPLLSGIIYFPPKATRPGTAGTAATGNLPESLRSKRPDISLHPTTQGACRVDSGLAMAEIANGSLAALKLSSMTPNSRRPVPTIPKVASLRCTSWRR